MQRAELSTAAFQCQRTSIKELIKRSTMEALFFLPCSSAATLATPDVPRKPAVKLLVSLSIVLVGLVLRPTGGSSAAFISFLM